ncbi:hypothetical protein SAMN04489798_5245 [Pseudomonas arsenicoxydans]|uniref:Uncharacterized protein n=1 Tax=Pseudomonas arsenicoxydans TaxID=702115 RepID=A0A1H0RG68_9PSED|nr:hypothetical protein SAMN04489798_5245 [Pseudomonas arsenicoxydans]
MKGPRGRVIEWICQRIETGPPEYPLKCRVIHRRNAARRRRADDAFQTFNTFPPMATATSNSAINPNAKLKLLPWAMNPITAGPARIPA